MNAERLIDCYERVADAPNAIAQLRRFVLDLAVRGKLVPQDANHEPAAELLKQIALEKARLLNAGKIKAAKVTPALLDTPFLLPSRWCWSQIADIGVLSPRNEAPDELQASFVPMPLIPAEYGAPSSHEVRSWGKIKKGYTHFAEGDVGLAKITPCFENGKSTVFRNLTNGMGSGTTELHVVRPLFADQSYILIFFKSPHFIETGTPMMTGTAGQKRVPFEYFAYSPFPLPPLAEQHRIVAKVDELMALCDRLERTRTEREATRDRFTTASFARLNAPDSEAFHDDAYFALRNLSAITARPDQIEQLRQTILSLAVRGKLVPQNTTDEPATELLKRVAKEIAVYSSANRLSKAQVEPIEAEEMPFAPPQGWEWSRLCALFKVMTDGDHQPPPKADQGVAFLTIGNITTGQLDFVGCRFVHAAYFHSLPPYRTPAKGDILYTVVGATYGRPALVKTDRDFCVQRHIAILKPAAEMDLRFLVWLLRSPLIYEQASRSTTGTAQPTIALRPLRNFIAPVPPLAEQHRIVAKVNELMTLCDGLEASLAAVDKTRSRLLEALLAEALAPVEERELEAAQ